MILLHNNFSISPFDNILNLIVVSKKSSNRYKVPSQHGKVLIRIFIFNGTP